MSYENDNTEKYYYYKNYNNINNNGIKSESEIVTKLIIEKIISLVINEYFVKEIFKNNPDYTFKYIKSMLNPLIKLDHINYDNDNDIDNEVNEPQKISLDNYLSNYIKTIMLNNKIKEIIEDNKIKRMKNKKLTNSSFKKVSNKNLINLNKENSSIKDIIKTKKSKPNLSFETHSIEDIPINIEPKEIKTLRYQYENQLRAKIERQQIKDFQKTKLVNVKINPNKKTILPIIDSEKFSFDSNGKIINLSSNNNFNLIKEFQEIPLKTKFIKLKPKEDDFYNFHPPPKDKIPVEKQSEKISQLNEMIKESKKLLKGNNYINIKKIIKTKIVPVREGGKVIVPRCPPSGDNFTYFNPEIGVSIKSNNREKNGTFKYSKLYNRYSNIEFKDILEEVVNINKNKVKNDSFNKNSLENIEESVINHNLDDNTTILSSNSNISSNRKIKSFVQCQNKKLLFSDRASSCKHIILNKSLLNNSSLLDSVEDCSKSFENGKIVSVRKCDSSKNLFINKLIHLKSNKYQSDKKMIKNENEAKSFDLIDKFNKNLIKNKYSFNEYNYYNYNNNLLPELKKPHLPKFTKLIKKNGIWIKSNLPMRINFAKNNSAIG